MLGLTSLVKKVTKTDPLNSGVPSPALKFFEWRIFTFDTCQQFEV
jgi:hypothetical protein